MSLIRLTMRLLRGATLAGGANAPGAVWAAWAAGAAELSRLMSFLMLSMRLLRGATLARATGAEATGVAAGADLVAPGHLSWNLHKTVFILVLIMSKKEPTRAALFLIILLAMTMSVLA